MNTVLAIVLTESQVSLTTIQELKILKRFLMSYNALTPKLIKKLSNNREEAT